jgi:hypothetical protein
VVHKVHGRRKSVASPTTRLRRGTSEATSAPCSATPATIESAIDASLAVARERPSKVMVAPMTQKGNGSQLVPLGSSRGAATHCSAMTTRA